MCSLCRSRRIFLELLIFWAATRIFSDVWDYWIKLISNKSPCSDMTDRRRLTGRQTFVMRVISSFTARCIFSLLGEQWWRERHADGVVIEFQACGFRDLFSSEDSWMSNSVVSEIDRLLGSQLVRGSFARVRRVLILHIMEEEDEEREDKREDGQ